MGGLPATLLFCFSKVQSSWLSPYATIDLDARSFYRMRFELARLLGRYLNFTRFYRFDFRQV
jgi:hypothetical protein